MVVSAPEAHAHAQRQPPRDGKARPARLRSALLGLALAAASTLFVVVLMEGILHIANYPPRQTDHQRLFIEHDPIRGWRNVPNAEGDYITEEYRVHLKYNSRGIRGPERSYAKPAGTYRIVMLGDSYVEGYMVEIQQRVSEVLERILNRRQSGRRVEVIALGTAGYSTDQELLWLESEGMRYQPDLVITMFYANDVWYNAQPLYWRGSKPLFVISGDSLVLTNVPVARTALDDRKEKRTLRDVVEQNSKLFWLAAGAIKNVPRLNAIAIRAGLAETPPEMVLDAGDKVAVPAEFNIYRSQETSEVKQAWRTTEALLARMRRDAERGSGRFLAFLVPLRGDIYTQEEHVRTRTSNTAVGWKQDAVVRHFATLCAAQNLACIDPTEEFRSVAARNDSRLYYRYDWHWNERGHALAATILAERIINDDLLQ